MKLTDADYQDALSKGFIARNHELDDFAEACYDQNSYREIKDCLTAKADKGDCEQWDITEAQWRAAQRRAIEVAMYWYEIE